MQLEIKRSDYLRIVEEVLDGEFPEVLESAKTQDKFCFHWANDEGATCTFGHYLRAILGEDADEGEIRDAFYGGPYATSTIPIHIDVAQRVCDHVGLRVGHRGGRVTIHITD